MYVVFRCEECGASVDSNMEECPACGELLPEMTLERDYDGEIDDELYELEHPVRAKISEMVDRYLGHLALAFLDYVEVVEEIDEEAKQVREERGHFRSVLWRWKRNLARNLYAVLWLFLMLVPMLAFDGAEDPMKKWVSFALVASVPLYIVSLWLLVKADTRESPLWSKVLQHALGAFNKLVFGMLLIGGVFFTLTTIISPYWDALWGL